MKKHQPTVRGRVMEALPNLIFKVEISDGRDEGHEQTRMVLCYLAGKMKINQIKVGIGDWVDIILDPLGGKATNRITRRF